MRSDIGSNSFRKRKLETGGSVVARVVGWRTADRYPGTPDHTKSQRAKEITRCHQIARTLPARCHRIVAATDLGDKFVPSPRAVLWSAGLAAGPVSQSPGHSSSMLEGRQSRADELVGSGEPPARRARASRAALALLSAGAYALPADPACFSVAVEQRLPLVGLAKEQTPPKGGWLGRRNNRPA